MDILVDEDVPPNAIHALLELGHNVKDIRQTSIQGLADTDLWNLALSERRMLITTDKGFTERRDDNHAGILVIRLRQPNRHKICNAVLLAMKRFTSQQWPGLLVVMRDQTMSISRQR